MKDKKTKPISGCGAIVRYGGHDASFIADIMEVEGAVVVRANDVITRPGVLTRPASPEATHQIWDFPKRCFWRPDLGVFVVPRDQVEVL